MGPILESILRPFRLLLEQRDRLSPLTLALAMIVALLDLDHSRRTLITLALIQAEGKAILSLLVLRALQVQAVQRVLVPIQPRSKVLARIPLQALRQTITWVEPKAVILVPVVRPARRTLITQAHKPLQVEVVRLVHRILITLDPLARKLPHII